MAIHPSFTVFEKSFICYKLMEFNNGFDLFCVV